MNAIVFWLVSGSLYAANTWHLLWLPLVWICFPGILLAAGIAMLFDIVAMRIADTAIESAAVISSPGQGIKRWDLVGARPGPSVPVSAHFSL